ncbi:uncharacterized protein LOC143373898 isoform X3 [Andrena cerasifolii]|uniref:uncharacterized protein LOC143373898 isoform X3 n=1 Tax=Andrena cerasifolii TaxID=2819439 RepID=UPI004037A77B
MVTMDQLINHTDLDTSSIIANPITLQLGGDVNFTSRSTQAFKYKDWNTATISQIIIFLLLIFGFFFAVLMYCKTCSSSCRAPHSDHSEPSAWRRERNNENVDTNAVELYTIYESLDRPPTYTEACSAPPLYGAPLNRVSMFDTPPTYPDTPKLADRVPHQINQASSILCHV